MGQLIVRNLDDAVIQRLKAKAKARGQSLEQTLREMLTDLARPNRAESIAAARALRRRIGRVTGDSTALIREDRENDEPHR